MKTFNFIPLPIPEESPTSLIKRLALHNGYGNCSKFFEHHMRFKTPKATVLIQGSRFETLLISQVGQSLHQRLRQGFYPLANPRAPGGAFKIGPLRIGRRLLRPRKAALCTECVKEGWERYIKDICLCTHCPVHNRHYLFECPHCQRKFTWKNQGGLLCSCGGTLESPICSPEEALAELRLFEILKSGNQTRLEYLLTLISLLGAPRNRISSVCTPLIFSAATTLAFEDYQAAASALSYMIDPSDNFEIEITLAKLSPIATKNSLSLLKQQLQISSPRQNPSYQPTSVPAKCMPTLLGVGVKKWREIRRTLPFGKKAIFNKLEAIQIKNAYVTTRQLNTSTKSIENEKLKALCHTQSETISLLKMNKRECSMLENHHLLSPLFRINQSPYFKKDEVERFRREYISVKELATRLTTSKAQLRRAIRNTPDINSWIEQTGRLFLIRTSDTTVIEKSLGKFPAVNRKLSSKKNIQTCDPQHVPTMSLAQAAKHLKTHTNTVVYYRDIGLLRCANNNTLQLSITDVENFDKKYATCAHLAKELKTSSNTVGHLLEPLKIYPISGGITNGHPTSVYDRATLPSDLKDLLNPMHDTFGAYWMNGALYSLNEAAQQLGILPSDFQNFFTTTIRPARAKYYRNARKVSPDEIELVRSLLDSYSKLSTLLIKRGITHAAFSRRFINPKFVHVAKFNNEEHLSSSDLSKLEAFLDRYCTPDEASVLLHLSPVQIYHLKKTGTLTPVFVSGYAYKHPLLERADVLNLLKLRTS
jgi:hypothetical protein